MVFFICDVCQETLKKNAVDKHCTRCRDCWYLSCVDCGKVFAGEEFRSHTSCISEAEKYQGALYKGNKKKNGKVDPQEKWMNSVRKAATSSKGSRIVVDMLRYLNNQDNVPRKEKKFMNYLKNSYRQQASQNDFKTVWDVIYKIHHEDDSNNNNNNSNNKKRANTEVSNNGNKDNNNNHNDKNNSDDAPVSGNKKKKQKMDDKPDDNNNISNVKEITEWKSWKSSIRTLLRNQTNRKGEFKSIRKLVLKLHKKLNKGNDESSLSKKELKNIFLEKVLKDKRIELNDDATTLKLV